MPRVKIDYVVSFSSEDSDNPASNLLSWGVNKRKWLCKKGEPSCSIVLQLSKAIQIQSIHIGAYHSALVEVLVGLSEKPSDPFEVLIPSCVFVPASESRREERVERVRNFTGEQLTSARECRWNRIRVVCSQPYNKHCKYGVSFIHIFSSETDSTESELGDFTARSGILASQTSSSDEEEFRPGELFAKHRAYTNTAETEIQIKQATCSNNVQESRTKLTKALFSKKKDCNDIKKRSHGEATHLRRDRDELLYVEDEEGPHLKIDNVVQKPSSIVGANGINVFNDGRKSDTTNDHTKENSLDITNKNRKRKKTNDETVGIETKQIRQLERGEPSKRRKVENSDAMTEEARTGRDELRAVLRGVVFALSGYVNPRRAALRDAAVRLGARYVPDYTAQCTHLVCAFPNTPKLRAVRESGTPCRVVLGEWIDACERERRRLPWHQYATEPSRSSAALASPEPCEPSDVDTEDEIEEVRAQLSRDEDGDATEPETESRVGYDDVVRPSKTLNDFLSGCACLIQGASPLSHRRALVERYLRAYGAIVLPEAAVEACGDVQYVICMTDEDCETPTGARKVRPAWVWRAHERRSIPDDPRLYIT
ncbi:unnamed protein product [Leptosia nina]|uniref:BRCT domain-containing protein n=1 Tax=Leptosia nina TaxID=320188 RepID=A0AAV1J3Q2_9NEOP